MVCDVEIAEGFERDGRVELPGTPLIARLQPERCNLTLIALDRGSMSASGIECGYALCKANRTHSEVSWARSVFNAHPG